ncbi:MAG: calcium/sodium antiporter [Chromatiales bacterium]
MLSAIFLSTFGLLILYFGAEALVRGSSNLGLRLGLSPLVVGLTIVAFGTSAPELAVSMNAAYIGQTDVSISNVIGSNIANIGLILGLSALIRPISIDVKLVRIDIPIMIAASLGFVLLMLDAGLTRTDGMLLFAGIIAFTVFNVLKARKARPIAQEIFEAEIPAMRNGLLREIIFIIVGLVMLTIGGKYLVDGAIQIARFAGISEAVIGLTIIAIGTSLPELATSVLAAARNMSDISVGNVVGSNIFNLLSVLGASALLAPLPQGNVTWVDIAVMLAFAIAVLPLARSDFILKRREGLLFLVGYVAYLAWLVMSA